MASTSALLDALCKEGNELAYLNFVPTLTSSPTPLEFYRNYVSKNQPVLIKGGCSHWPAVKSWTLEALHEQLKGVTVSVEATPNGRGDAFTKSSELGDVFALPESQRWDVSNFINFVRGRHSHRKAAVVEFLARMRGDKSKSGIDSDGIHATKTGVYYISHQNGSLSDPNEFASLLMSEVDNGELPFAKQAFAAAPDATNFWMGGADAVTSLHKDHYENTYAVIRGRKHFTLFAPTSVNHLTTKDLKAAQYQERSDGSFALEPSEEPSRPWIVVDPDDEASHDEAYTRCQRIDVTVEAGDVLYLPSLWYHQVRQEGTDEDSGMCIAVNAWYNMEFDVKYVYHDAIEKLGAAVKEAQSTGQGPSN